MIELFGSPRYFHWRNATLQSCQVSDKLEEQAFANWAGYAFRMASCYLATAALYGYMLGAEPLKAT